MPGGDCSQSWERLGLTAIRRAPLPQREANIFWYLVNFREHEHFQVTVERGRKAKLSFRESRLVPLSTTIWPFHSPQ